MNADTASRDARLAAGEVLDYERVDGLCDGVPADYAAEDALLVAVLKRPAVLDGLGLRAADLLHWRHGACWTALLRLHGRGERVDFETLLLELRALGYEDAGALVADLWQTNGVSAEAPRYAERITEMRVRRQLIDMAQRVAAGSWDTSEPLCDVLRGANLALTVARETVTPRATARPAALDLEEALDL